MYWPEIRAPVWSAFRLMPRVSLVVLAASASGLVGETFSREQVTKVREAASSDPFSRRRDDWFYSSASWLMMIIKKMEK